MEIKQNLKKWRKVYPKLTKKYPQKIIYLYLHLFLYSYLYSYFNDPGFQMTTFWLGKSDPTGLNQFKRADGFDGHNDISISDNRSFWKNWAGADSIQPNLGNLVSTWLSTWYQDNEPDLHEHLESIKKVDPNGYLRCLRDLEILNASDNTITLEDNINGRNLSSMNVRHDSINNEIGIATISTNAINIQENISRSYPMKLSQESFRKFRGLDASSLSTKFGIRFHSVFGKCDADYVDEEAYDYCEDDEHDDDEDYDEYDDDEDDGGIAYAGGRKKRETLPPDLWYATSMAYEESFLRKVGSQVAAEEYIETVLQLAQDRLTDKSLGSKIHLDVKKGMRFLKGLKLEVDEKDMYEQAYYIQTNSNESLVIFVYDLDTDDAMGVAKRAAGCDSVKNKIIVKWRSSPLKAGIVLAHEFGHLALGMFHDDKEDGKIERKTSFFNVNGPCDTGNTMMNKSPPMDGRLPVWSECSRFRLEKFYAQGGSTCLKTASPPKIELPDGIEHTVQAGGTILLKCETYGVPKPDLLFYHGSDILLTGDRHTVHDDGSLEIRDVQLADDGEYTCTAINFMSYTTARMSLHIQKDVGLVISLTVGMIGILMMIAVFFIYCKLRQQYSALPGEELHNTPMQMNSATSTSAITMEAS